MAERGIGWRVQVNRAASVPPSGPFGVMTKPAYGANQPPEPFPDFYAMPTPASADMPFGGGPKVSESQHARESDSHTHMRGRANLPLANQAAPVKPRESPEY
jgi:hypothetical protein